MRVCIAQKRYFLYCANEGRLSLEKESEEKRVEKKIDLHCGWKFVQFLS